MNDSVVIIGGGLGGLFCGALLACEGLRVTVLEKNAVAGGGLQCFKRDGAIFETGMHVAGGLRDGGSVARICKYLGIYDRLTLEDVDDACMDEVTYGVPGDVYQIASGRERFIDSLARRFEHQRDNLHRYVNALYTLADEVDMFWLRPNDPYIMRTHSEEFLIAADEFIARYITNPKLQGLLAYISTLYGGVAGHTPAYIHALISVLYINGPSRFVGGSQQLSDALIDVIQRHGGAVVTRAQVNSIEVADRLVTGVVTADGTRYEADTYISAVHPREMLSLLPSDAFTPSYRRRLCTIPVSVSSFSLYLTLKPGSVPYINHTCYYQGDYGHEWRHGEYNRDTWPTGLMYMTPPDQKGARQATRMLVNCLMPYSEVERWEGTSPGQRGAEYETWKQTHIELALSRLEEAYPGIRESIASVTASSPLTVRDYFHTWRGSIYGYSKDCQNIMLSQIPVVTKIKNLLLTGQNINLHGICGVPLTAINTAEAIVGLNTIINKL